MNCRVKRCKENHTCHYCCLCQEPDSNHFASECPKGTTLYHGTRKTSITGNPSHDLTLSTSRFGAGVYFVDSLSKAKQISQQRGDGSGSVVFVCHVNLGQIINVNSSRGGPYISKWDSKRRIRPPSVVPFAPNSYTEYCLRNYRKCCIKEVLLVKGSITTLNEELNIIKEAALQTTSTTSNELPMELTRYGTFSSVLIPDIREPYCRTILVILLQFLILVESFTLQIAWVIHTKKTVSTDLLCYDIFKNAFISYIVFFVFLTISRTFYITYLLYTLKDRKTLYWGTFIMAFFAEMPLMVSSVFMLYACPGNLIWNKQILTLALHLMYPINFVLMFVIDSFLGLYGNWRRVHGLTSIGSDSNFSMCTAISLFLFMNFVGVILAMILYVPVYLKLTGAWDFKINISRVGGKIDMNNMSSTILYALVYIGTLGECAFIGVCLSLISSYLVLRFYEYIFVIDF